MKSPFYNINQYGKDIDIWVGCSFLTIKEAVIKRGMQYKCCVRTAASPGNRVVCQAALNHSDNVPTMNNWGGKKAHLGLWFLSMTGLHHWLGASSEPGQAKVKQAAHLVPARK